MKQKPEVSEPLRHVRISKGLMRLAQAAAFLLFAAAVYSFYIRRYHLGWFFVAVCLAVVMFLAVPAAAGYRAQ